MGPGALIVAGVLGVYLIYSGILPNILKLLATAIAGPLPGTSTPPPGGTGTQQ